MCRLMLHVFGLVVPHLGFQSHFKTTFYASWSSIVLFTVIFVYFGEPEVVIRDSGTIGESVLLCVFNSVFTYVVT